jgi:putative ATPase
LMKGLGYGGGYKYPHNFEGNYVPEDYLPEALKARRFYKPSTNGLERELSERYEDIQRQLAARGREPGEEG